MSGVRDMSFFFSLSIFLFILWFWLFYHVIFFHFLELIWVLLKTKKFKSARKIKDAHRSPYLNILRWYYY
jgi:hypothetical protein